jgi:hypothetical protein
VEWGAYQSLRNNSCAASATLTFPGTTLAGFTTTITCNRTAHSELTTTVNMDRITATACNDPPCPNSTPGVADYLERQISVTVGQ